jgi:hypothetical protein
MWIKLESSIRWLRKLCSVVVFCQKVHPLFSCLKFWSTGCISLFCMWKGFMFARSMLDDIYVLLGSQMECFGNLTCTFLSDQEVSCLLDHSSHRQSHPRFFLYPPHMGFHVTTASGTIRSPVLDTGTWIIVSSVSKLVVSWHGKRNKENLRMQWEVWERKTIIA